TFTQEIDMDDVEKPKIINHFGKDKEIMLLFNKEMDPATVTNYENYIINFGGPLDYLPKDSGFELIYDDKTWTIKLPKKVDGKTVDIGQIKDKQKL
ncbi:MAG: hypothetical protein GX987_08355, partial [Tissierellia bacterium]|nr:hypothetical protein [Tissierellia bacterium]